MGMLLRQMLSRVSLVCGFALVFSACGGVALAVRTPEIDAGSATSAVTLVVGGVLLLTDKYLRR